MKRPLRYFAIVPVAALTLMLTTCQRLPDTLTQVRTLGVLRVATVNTSTTYYLGANGPKGFEYDLAKDFASRLGVRLEMVVEPDRVGVLKTVANGHAQIGAGLAVNSARRQRVRFSPPYTSLPLRLIYKSGHDKPGDLAAASGHLVLPGGTALADWLRVHRPNIDFRVDRNANTEELMARLAHGKIDASVANTDLVAMNQRYYPNLRVAFTLHDVRQQSAWAFAPGSPRLRDDRLYNKAIAYLEQTRTNGRLHMLRDRYFGHAARLGFVGGAEFARQIKARLHKWKPYFKHAAKRYGLDWRLLAAVGYQESRWDQHAVSPTTVKGIMMLTRSTAARVDVDDRENPQQSINGGARYFIDLRKRLPDTIKPPDRTWFALAAYNIGLGHVLDARRLLKRHGRNPNVWVNLRDALAWLSQKRYLAHTKYGYAKGKQAAAYVGNIRAYYDILTWMGNKKHGKKPPAADEKPSSGGADDSKNDALPSISIDSPAF